MNSTLSNGLEVVCAENPTTHTVALSAFIMTSARAEVASLAGIRQFVAEMVVDCGAYGNPEVADRLDALGIQVLAGAATDFSEISLLGAAEDVEAIAVLLSKIVFGARLNAGSIVRLRNESTIALRQEGDLPQFAATRKAGALLYPNHPLGWPVEGLFSSVAGFTLADVERFYQGSYLSNNILVSIAGGVPTDEALAAVEAAFGGALPGKALPESSREPLPPVARRAIVRCSSTVAVVHIGARAPGPSEPTYAAAAVALGILGSGMGSRMYVSLRRDRSIAYTVGAQALAAKGGSRVALVVSCPPELVGKAETLVMRDVHSLTRELASPEEIQRAKEYICTSYALGHQRSMELAHQLGALQVVSDRGHRLAWELPRKVRQTTAEEIRNAAREMFAQPVIVRALP